MSSDRVYLTKEEQEFLTERLDIDDPQDATDKFASLMLIEGADPVKLKEYLVAIMKRLK